MKYFLLLSLIIFYGSISQGMKRKLLSRYENLEREIFMRKLYRDYSFDLLQQIPVKNPINQKVFDSLLAQGMQKYCRLPSNWNQEQNGLLKPFDEYSLSELENCVTS